jgi:hypothetical protein
MRQSRGWFGEPGIAADRRQATQLLKSAGFRNATRVMGLEPTTTGSTVRYSNQLSYTPKSLYDNDLAGHSSFFFPGSTDLQSSCGCHSTQTTVCLRPATPAERFPATAGCHPRRLSLELRQSPSLVYRPTEVKGSRRNGPKRRNPTGGRISPRHASRKGVGSLFRTARSPRGKRPRPKKTPAPFAHRFGAWPRIGPGTILQIAVSSPPRPTHSHVSRSSGRDMPAAGTKPAAFSVPALVGPDWIIDERQP